MIMRVNIYASKQKLKEGGVVCIDGSSNMCDITINGKLFKAGHVPTVAAHTNGYVKMIIKEIVGSDGDYQLVHCGG